MNETHGTTRTEAVRVELLEGGAIWQVRLATPKANILDMEKITALTEIFTRAAADPAVKAMLLEGEGPNFSFGASVEEHLPGSFETMIPAFHRLFGAMLDSAVPTLAVVRGQCLGGGLELASFCHRVFASPDAKLGQPEIALGVIAPVASVILPERIGRAAAEDLCISGRICDAREACELGLVDRIADDPGAAAFDWARTHLLPRSASSLRFAVRAVRTGFHERFRTEFGLVERLYLDELMETADAKEGLQAFCERRRPEWSNA